MTKPFLDRLRMRAEGNAQRGAGVAQIMEARVRRQLRGQYRRLEVALVEHLVTQDAAMRRRKHEMIRLDGTTCEVRSQLVAEELGQRHRTVLVGLRLTEHEALSVDLRHRLGDESAPADE